MTREASFRIPARRPAASASPLSVVLSGPRETAAQRAALSFEAAALRAAGHVVTTPLDIARACAAPWSSVSYARAKAEALLDADPLVLLDGWQEDPHALASFEAAEAMGPSDRDLTAALAT